MCCKIDNVAYILEFDILELRSLIKSIIIQIITKYLK